MEIRENKLGNSPQDEWYIIRDGNNVMAHGFNPQGKALHTGQPTLEVTSVYNDYVTRCEELNITPVEQ
jgi:hypothetical protein